MPWHPGPAPSADAAPPAREPAPAGPSSDAPAPAPSLADLGIAGISRRQLAWVGLAVLAAWIVVGFAGQAAEASRMATLVDAARARNAAATEEAAALRSELALVTQERWILQQARAYQLGSRKERPFALAPGAAPLPDDAPGSPARRLGAEPARSSPLQGWLEVLFGPGS